MCGICLETVGADVLTPCGHLFHVECLRTWLYINPTCPMCRQQVPMIDFVNMCKFKALERDHNQLKLHVANLEQRRNRVWADGFSVGCIFTASLLTLVHIIRK